MKVILAKISVLNSRHLFLGRIPMFKLQNVLQSFLQFTKYDTTKTNATQQNFRYYNLCFTHVIEIK